MSKRSYSSDDDERMDQIEMQEQRQPLTSETSPASPSPSSSASGQFHDGICDCCCPLSRLPSISPVAFVRDSWLRMLHPSLWMACCCQPVVLLQLSNRYSQQQQQESPPTYFWTRPTIHRVAYFTVVWTVFRFVNLLIVAATDPNTDHPIVHAIPKDLEHTNFDHDTSTPLVEPGWVYHIVSFVDSFLAYLLWIVIALWLFQLRWSLRRRYGVTDQQNCLDDLVCSCCCPSLVARQLLRQTTEVEGKPSSGTREDRHFWQRWWTPLGDY